VGTKFLDLKSRSQSPSKAETKLISSRAGESRFPWVIQRVIGATESAPYHRDFAVMQPKTMKSRIYSAAAANAGLTFADDAMKSEMRGTISDLKRDPLNTP
jgi:hypothetical protein